LPIRFPHPHDAAPAALGSIRTDGGPKQGHGSENFSGLTYLFLTNQGGAYYESKDDRNALRASDEPLKRSSSTGQNLRSFITDYVIPEVRKTIKDFYYQFHDLRATFGINWVDAVLGEGDTHGRYIWAREQLRKLMWHKLPTTTDRYINYRKHLQDLEKAEAHWNQELLDLIRSA
jgi:hypothetical protein